MDVLLVCGHPDGESFCAGITEAIADGLHESQINHQVLKLAEQSFDPVLRFGYRKHMPDDPFIVKSQQYVREAKHLIIVFPVWHGAEPSLLKGWFDRVWTPGVAYQMKGLHFDKLLAGTSASLVCTSHAPGFYSRMHRSYPLHRLRKDVLAIGGVKVTKTLAYGSVDMKSDTAVRREQFKNKARAHALQLGNVLLSKKTSDS